MMPQCAPPWLVCRAAMEGRVRLDIETKAPLVRAALDAARTGRQSSSVPQRQRYLFVCTNLRPEGNPKGSCAAKGSEAMYQALKAELFQRGLAKLEARACTSSCLDQCSAGASILVEPDHYFYGRVTAADVPDIVEALAKGERVERLVMTGEDLERG
jgi:(2Fe-2S) ferredoxin